ncbi:MAG TPA: glycosyltransferase family 4 protein [Gallionella sp.]|nr:glycosyltransferase family 4 protein [Gallionella sp.]
MKILFLTENLHCGGLDSFLVSLVNHWPQGGDDIRVVCNEAHPGYVLLKEGITRPATVERHDITTYTVLVAKSQRHALTRVLRRALSPVLRYLFMLYYLLKLRTLLRLWGADRLVVVNGGHPGGDTCRAAVIAWRLFQRGKPAAIYNFHNLAVKPRWFEWVPEKLLDAWLVHSAGAIVGVSKICAESLRERLGNAGMAKVSHIYNGIAPPVTQPMLAPSLRQELNLEAGAPLCLMLGTYEPRKGHDFLFQAFRKVVAEVPSAHLLVCGFGYPEEIERVTGLVSRYGMSDHVTLQGFRRDVDAMLAQADLLLVASQAFESFGLTSVEAMANHVPVIATRVGGIPEVVEDGEGGYCVAPDDVDGYAARIIAFLKDSELRKVQAEKGYARYRRMFSAERMAADYATLIRKS